MKPLGTITQCFPHVDDETRSTIQSIMDVAVNYSDFAVQLCKKACTKTASSMIRYFAFFHAFRLDLYPQMEQLYKSDDDPSYYEPLYFASMTMLREVVEMEVMRTSLVKAMKELPNDWLACHLYLEWRRVADSYYPETDTDKQIMEKLREHIENDDAFEFFRPLYIGLEAYGMMMKGYHDEALQTYEKGLSLARKYDDLSLVADGLYLIAERIRIDNPSYAIEIMSEHNDIAKEIGYTWALARNSLVLGWIMIYRGEFNAALSHVLEFQKLSESINHPSLFSNFVLPFVYNFLGDGGSALNYLTSIREKVDDRIRYMAVYYLMSALAYINTGEEKEALSYLDTGKQLAIQSGYQSHVNLHQLLEGIYEKEQGDLLPAAETLKVLLKHLAKNDFLYRTICLFHLADIEVECYSPEREDIYESWLERFEAYVEEKDYPGFIAQAKILRIKLLQKQGEPEKAQSLVKEVMKVAESPSMNYLKRMVAIHLPEATR